MKSMSIRDFKLIENFLFSLLDNDKLSRSDICDLTCCIITILDYIHDNYEFYQ